MAAYRPAAVLACLLLAACAGPSYYMQAVAGHYQLNKGQQDIEALVAAPATDPQLKARLITAMEIRRFASEELGLPDDASYTRFVQTGREAATWNVIAAPELSLEPYRWCFLFAGCVPYRGYFDPQGAAKLAARLEARGYDVTIAKASAYSTLGWFDDPLLDTMLRDGDGQLAAVIFHELAHRLLYVPGDAAFSEAFASFVEETSVSRWLVTSGREAELPAWRRQQAAAAAFDELLGQARDELDAVYRSASTDADKRALKAKALGALSKRYRQLVAEQWAGQSYYQGWFEQAPNNARLALVAAYRGGLCAFRALYDAAGRDMRAFTALAEKQAALGDRARRAWLEQPCEAVAPAPNM